MYLLIHIKSQFPIKTLHVFLQTLPGNLQGSRHVLVCTYPRYKYLLPSLDTNIYFHFVYRSVKEVFTTSPVEEDVPVRKAPIDIRKEATEAMLKEKEVISESVVAQQEVVQVETTKPEDATEAADVVDEVEQDVVAPIEAPEIVEQQEDEVVADEEQQQVVQVEAQKAVRLLFQKLIHFNEDMEIHY